MPTHFQEAFFKANDPFFPTDTAGAWNQPVFTVLRQDPASPSPVITSSGGAQHMLSKGSANSDQLSSCCTLGAFIITGVGS